MMSVALAKSYKKDAKKIKKRRECFWEKYPEIFNYSSENEVKMDVEVDTTMRTKPPIDREEKLRKVKEKLLSKRTNERFTYCDGVMLDPNLTSTPKIIRLQKGIEDSTRRKIYYASLQGELFEKCCLRSKKVYKENEVYKTVGAIFTKIIQTCSGIQSNYVLYCSFKLHSL